MRIARIGGVDVSGDSRFVATSFTVSGGVATATFNRAVVNDFLRTQGSGGNTVSFTVTGRSASGAWTSAPTP